MLLPGMPAEMETGEDGGEEIIRNLPRTVCAHCSESITDADTDVVECFGKCKLTIHTKCLPSVTEEEVQVLKKAKNAVFVCDTCLLLNGYAVCNNDDVLSEIKSKLNELTCVVEMANNFEAKVKEIVNNELVRFNKRPVDVFEEKEVPPQRYNLRSSSKRRKVDSEEINGTPNDETPKRSFSFADAVKIRNTNKPKNASKTPPKMRKPDPVIIIKPKETQQVELTRNELRKKVDPKKLNVGRVFNGRDGSVVVSLKDDESISRLKENVEKSMGDQYDVCVRDSMKPTIKLIGMNDEFDEEELKNNLIQQNEVCADMKHFKLRKMYCNDKLRYAKYSAIIEVDADTFYKAMKVGKLNCGWDRCRVFDGLEVTRCYKCCGFNHKIANCKAEGMTCPICSGDHPVKECISKEQKCANCKKVRSEQKLNVDVNHSAWSNQCPVYLRQMKKRNERVDFSI